MAQAHAPHDANLYYVPHGSRWPVVRLGRAVHRDVRPGQLAQRGELGQGDVLRRPRACLAAILFKWFGDVIRESISRLLQQAGGHLVPHGHGVVHLFRGDVLRRVLRRAVLRAAAGACRGSAAKATA